MLIVTPLNYRKQRRPQRRKRGTPPTPPGPTAPVLVAVTYETGQHVVLTFDRDIDIAAIDVSAFIVDDGAEAFERFEGYAASSTGSQSVQVDLSSTGPSTQNAIILTATATNGIVSSEGVAWAGVSDVEIPFS